MKKFVELGATDGPEKSCWLLDASCWLKVKFFSLRSKIISIS